MSLFALVLVGFISGLGLDAGAVELYKTAEECEASRAKWDKETVKAGKLPPQVEAIGAACVKVSVAPGKPV